MEHEPNANGIQRRQCSLCPTYGKGGTVPRPTRCNEHVDPEWCVVGSHNVPAIAFPISSTDIVDTSHHECHDTEAIHCSLAGHPCAVFCAPMCLTFAYCPSLGQRLGASRQRLSKRLGASRQRHAVDVPVPLPGFSQEPSQSFGAPGTCQMSLCDHQITLATSPWHLALATHASAPRT